MSIVGSEQWMYASGKEVTQQSLKFNDDESQYLSWTPAAAGNRKTFTYSTWLKRGKISSDNPTWGMTAGTLNNSSNPRTEMQFNPSSNIVIGFNASGASWNESTTNAVFRDPSAWYHLVVAVDMTQATSTDRLKLWVNNELQTWSSYSVPAQNTDLPINNTLLHAIGDYVASVGGSYRHDGYLSDVYFIDGQALDASSFGQFTNGYWEKKDYAGSYGTNGFHLTFADDVVSEGFNAVTYTGNGSSSGQSISGLGFSPDFVWIKNRNVATTSHSLYDSVRGATKYLSSHKTDAEATLSTSLTSFDADGFSVGSWGEVNFNGRTFVAWAWDAGSGSPVSNTDGTITSTVKANPDYGFSIVSYTGTGTSSETVGHSLGTAPSMLIVKRRDAAFGWNVYHSAIGANNVLFLQSTDASSSTSLWNSTAPTSSVFSLGASSGANASGGTYIAYCFAEVAGYSKISSYSGNGSTQTITTGFRPAFVMIKSYAGGTTDWFMYDNTRKPANPNDLELYANLSSAEYDSGRNINFTSTGFELDTANYVNNSGVDYIYMAFADTREAAFWKDVSGQGNHWTPNNLDYRDSLIDSPTNNFATLNVLNKYSGVTLSEGNLTAKGPDAAWRNVDNTIHMSSGKWYWEVYINNVSTYQMHGIVPTVRANGRTDFYADLYPGTYSDEWGYRNNGYLYNSASPNTSWGSTYTTGDVLGFALDMDAGTLDVTKNGASTGSQITGISGTYRTCCTVYGSSSKASYNFGQDSTFSGARPAGGNTDANGIGDFAYAPPSGYLALCTANLPTPTIIDGSTAFNTVLWTGDSVDNRNITGIGFDADFTWLKARSNGNSHGLADTVRGNSAPNMLSSNQTVAEFDWTGIFKGHITDGFTVGTDSAINLSGQTYVAWNWKAGGTAVSNTAGSITSQVSANVDAGFSIVSYTGASGQSVGHGLGVAPRMIIVKDRDAVSNWAVYHQNVQDSTTNGFLEFTTSAVQTGSNPRFLSTVSGTSQPTNSVFYVRNYAGSSTCNTGNNYIAYCFANSDVIKVGSYTGNGSADGPFVYTGGRVQWLMIKSSTTAQSWEIRDNKREPFNDALRNVLFADSSGAETVDAFPIDFTSNGFKLRNSGNGTNASGAIYIYLAIMESPLKFANAR